MLKICIIACTCMSNCPQLAQNECRVRDNVREWVWQTDMTLWDCLFDVRDITCVWGKINWFKFLSSTSFCPCSCFHVLTLVSLGKNAANKLIILKG